jgi:nucleoside-diphosphate-sugar epimerase
VYVEDVVDAWLRALRSEARDQRINVGSGVERTIDQLIDDVLAAFGRDRASYPIRTEAELPGDQRAIRADIERARELLGWSPRTPFELGLRATVEWARSTWKAD